jgi:hypothetical protein
VLGDVTRRVDDESVDDTTFVLVGDSGVGWPDPVLDRHTTGERLLDLKAESNEDRGFETEPSDEVFAGCAVESRPFG